MVPKAPHDDILGRYREILSDPLNLLIHRVEDAGTVADGLVVLHNGHRVPISGDFSYYDDFSNILILNRGVHEPVEEFVFQSLLPHLPQSPVMLELGAMWAHYSMWMLQARPNGRAFMVEPDPSGIEAGRRNFQKNGYDGVFEQRLVGPDDFTVDDFLFRRGIAQLTILHSDIQGAELAMLEGAARAFESRRIDYALVSTHGQIRHQTVLDRLVGLGYRIDVNSAFDTDTTSHDGLVLAVRPDLARFMPDVTLLGREMITQSAPEDLVAYLARLSPAAPVASTGAGAASTGIARQLRKLLGRGR